MPSPVAEPFRLAFDGRHAEAAAWWGANGEPFTEAMTWADSPDRTHRARALDVLDRLGATGTADRLRSTLGDAGQPVAVVHAPAP